MSYLIWNKPVLSLYRERDEQPEREPFAVIKAKKLIISASDEGGFNCKIEDFFCLMGDVDEVEPTKKYVVCWFDDSIGDFYAAFRRLSGVVFPSRLSYVLDKRNKRTYNSELRAKYAKLR